MVARVRRKIDLLKHEAGHLVVGKLMGFETGDVHISKIDAGAQITLAPDLTDLSEAKDYIKRRVIVLYAGAMSEALRNSVVKKTQVFEDFDSQFAVNDFAKIRELLLLLAGLDSQGSRQDNLNSYVDEYSDRSLKLVEKYATVIRAVADEMWPLIPGEVGIIPKSDVDNLSSVKSIAVGSER